MGHLGKVHFDLALVSIELSAREGLKLARQLNNENNPVGHWVQVVLLCGDESLTALNSTEKEFEQFVMPLMEDQLLARIRVLEAQLAETNEKALEFLK